MAKITELHINGRKVRIDVDGERSLLSVLREDLELTGAKYGCGEAQCGACTVLIGDTPVRACVTAVSTVGNRPVTTIEGIAEDGRLHPLQEAFLETNAFECGYCTTGMILSGIALLRQNPKPSRADIIQAMDGNICRCGSYPRIFAAFAQAARKEEP